MVLLAALAELWLGSSAAVAGCLLLTSSSQQRLYGRRDDDDWLELLRKVEPRKLADLHARVWTLFFHSRFELGKAFAQASVELGRRA